MSRWAIHTIGDVATVIAGQSPEGSHYNEDGEGLPFYQGKKEFRDRFIGAPQVWTREVTKEAKENDILMSVRAPVGPVNFATEPCCIGRGLAAIRAKPTAIPEFLFYFFKHIESSITGNAGAVFPSINKSQIEAIKIPLPPLAEQKRIVAFLDEAFASISQAAANTDRNLENAKELPGALLEKALALQDDWQETTLAEIAEFKNGLNFTRTSKGENIRIVGVKDFQNEYRVPTEDLEYVTIDGKLPPAYELRKNDILTVRSNGNKQLIGRCIIAGDVSEKTSHSGFTIRIRATSPKIHPEFLAYALKSRSTRARLVASGGGANISSLNQGALSSLPIAFPDVKTQEKIVENIHAMMDMCKQLQDARDRKAEQLDELKKSLLHQAFSGKLTGKEAEAA